MESVEAYVSQKRHEHLDQLQALLRIPSISVLSEHQGDMERAAQWLAEHMRQIGLHAEVLETNGHPVVYGEWMGAPGAPTALIYGHYDVQPVDPLPLWHSPPFSPIIRENKIYARGACDDKGQVFMHLKAIEALLQTEGKLPVNVRLVLEGEEEMGSPSLEPFVRAHLERLQADVLVISDTTMYGPDQPAICYGLRGIAALEVHVRTAASDLHSGLFGGPVPNALQALADLLASLREPGQQRVAVEGFYDAVREPSAAERAQMAALGFDEVAFKRELGVKGLVGEPEYSPLERVGARPTLELNGMWGGFTERGTKTVIPAEAHAKITCRLVPDQDPEQIFTLVKRQLEANAPPYVELTVERGHHARPWLCEPDHPALQAASRALAWAFGREPVFMRVGGSIPVVETFASLLGVPVVLMGFGLSDENVHAPNEHFRLENFDRGIRAICRYWHELATPVK